MTGIQGLWVQGVVAVWESDLRCVRNDHVDCLQ